MLSTIHSLQMLATDLEDRVVREMQFQGDAERQINDAFNTLREAMASVEMLVMNAFSERSRALAATLGTGKPEPDTIESTTRVKLKSRSPSLSEPVTE